MFRGSSLRLLHMGFGIPQELIQLTTREQLAVEDDGGDVPRVVNIFERVCIQQDEIRYPALVNRAILPLQAKVLGGIRRCRSQDLNVRQPSLVQQSQLIV